MQTPRRRLCISVLLLVCGVAGYAAQAEDYPTRSVKLITQGAAASGPDVVARIVAEPLGRLWGQQVVILNHPGAGGSVAARQAASAAADGYTLYMPATSAFIVMPEMFPNLPFHLDRDFVRIGFVAEQPMVIAVAPSLGVNSLQDLIALAKARPGQILYAANARGTLPHLTAERFRKEAGIELALDPPNLLLLDEPTTHLDMASVDVLLEALKKFEGAICFISHDVYFIRQLGDHVIHVKSGKVSALAVTTDKRSPVLPDVPTVGETIPRFIATGWFPLLAPAGTPDWIVRKVGEDLRTVLDQPAVRQKLAQLATFARPMSGAETTEFIRREQELWRPVVKQIGVTQ